VPVLPTIYSCAIISLGAYAYCKLVGADFDTAL